MKNKSIFTRQNQTLINLFRDAQHPEKVLCIPLDYAKATHVALCCNGAGAVLKKAFPVKNNPEGIAFLIEVAEGICRKHHINREHVFFGGEDCGTFSLNFIYGLRKQGFVVMGVNAKDAKEQRENMQASSDELDLLGIAKLLLNRRGATAGGKPGAERALRTLTRHRKAQVRLKTATSNRIHQIVDQLFPGFLDERSSGIPPFSEASLYLMQDRFSPALIAARQDKALLRQLKGCGLQQAEAAIGKLKVHARQVLAHPPELTGLLQTSLAGEISLYRCLGANIDQVGREIAQQLARTPGAMLTTVRGIGITLAAGVAAEIGPPATQPGVRRLGSWREDGEGVAPLQPHPQGLHRPMRQPSRPARSRRPQGRPPAARRQQAARRLRHGPALPAHGHAPDAQRRIVRAARTARRRNPRRTPDLLPPALARAPRQMGQGRRRARRLR